jgi:1-aminocyclopropane-1-carboxylate deaminase/D-cysteine desulfhydrase-like pyridoxal-dependent ACC family enzyme
MCIHIESTTLANRTYNLVPESESKQCEAQVNLTEVAEDLNQHSEELSTSFAQEGKPRCIIPFFQLF